MTEQVVVDGNGMMGDTTLASLEPQVLQVVAISNAEEDVSSCPWHSCGNNCLCVSYSCPCVNKCITYGV